VALGYGGSPRPATFLRTETLLASSTVVDTDRASDLLGRVPLAFERNDGQFDQKVRFSARGETYEIALGAVGPRLALTADDPAGPRTEIGVTFVGARPAREMRGIDRLQGQSSYYRGGRESDWAAGAPTYGHVRASAIYDGIDVDYYGRDRQLEYDFLVAPGADPSQIAMAFSGVDRLTIDETGDLVLHVGDRAIRQHRPVAYQNTREGRRTVDADYLLLGTNRVVIALGDYDRDRPLVIDPVLAY
jgi:hypothetical protein